MPAPTCRCLSARELKGQEAVDYIDHLEYVTEGDHGWEFRCPETLVEWVMPYAPKDAPIETVSMQRVS
jgi:hypothetical protein